MRQIMHLLDINDMSKSEDERKGLTCRVIEYFNKTERKHRELGSSGVPWTSKSPSSGYATTREAQDAYWVF
jgi:hypothetical protein